MTSSGTGSGRALAAAPVDRRVLEAADAVEPRLAQPVEQQFEVGFGLAREADDEGAAQRQVGTDLAPAPDALERVLGVGRALHQLQHARAAVLERNVQVRQDLAVRHQRDHVVDVRVRVDIVHAHPRAERAERAREVDELRLDGLAAPEAGRVLEVGAVGAGVLRDHQQFLHAGLHQALGLEHHVADRPAGEVAAHRRDDAEGAAVIAALGNLQVGVVPRREADALRRHQVDERVVQRRQLLVHGLHDFFVRVRAGHLEHRRVTVGDRLGPGAEAAGDDHLAVARQRLADRIERFVHRVVDEAAGVDHDEVGVLVGADDVIALRAQAREDAFGIHQRLGAAEGDEADAGRGCHRG